MEIETVFLQDVRKRFREYKTLGDKTLEQVSNDDWHWQPDKESNSIAIIIQHLHGNMKSRWTNFLTEDGEKESRQRDAEFEVHNQSKEDLKQLWEEGWQVLFATLESLQPADLRKKITIRSQPLSVVDAIIRQVAHYSYHVGQIVYIGKMIQSENWQSLSIPKKGSLAFNAYMKEKHG